MKKPSSSAPYEPGFLKGRKGAIVIGLLGLLQMAAGIIMYVRDDVRIGVDPGTMQDKILTGPYVLLLGSLFVVFAWFMWRDHDK